ncbi:MAG TPA: hypothetical protein VFI91_10160 [Longimicrobiaceae bacterium]|nr:hypothetical protein [Longimicrobiaceae bacterium]
MSNRAASLQAYARCLDLLASEMEAMRSGDVARLRALAEEREEAERELGKLSADESPYSGLGALAEEAVRELGERLKADRRRQDEVERLEEESLPLVRGITRRLATGKYGGSGAGPARFNVLL